MAEIKRKAFTLMELAIVLIIISIIIVGLVKGEALIKAARLSSARSLTIKSAIQEIKGMVAWYETSIPRGFDAAEMVNNAQITRWNDISPSSVNEQKNQLFRPEASDELIYNEDGINSIPSLEFKHFGKLYLSTFHQGTFRQATIFVVFRPTAIADDYFTVLDAYNSRFAIELRGDSVALDAGGVAETGSISGINFDERKSYILAAYFDRDKSHVYVNNATDMAGNIEMDPGAEQIVGLVVGGAGVEGSADGDFIGLISEVVIYDRPLSLNERRMVMNYLAKKYKINVLGL